MSTYPDHSPRGAPALPSVFLAAGLVAATGGAAWLGAFPGAGGTMVRDPAPGRAAVERAVRTASADWRAADADEFRWLKAIYGVQAESEGNPLSIDGQPFRLTRFPGRAGDENWHLVLWPRICHAGRCRVDVVRPDRDRVLGSLYAAGARPADAFHDGRPLVVDASGRVAHWAGLNYAIEPAR